MKKYVDNHNEFIRKLIRKELNLLYENDNKYMDDILDRMKDNKTGGIYDTDKEYLKRLKAGEDVSDLEQGYDIFKKMKDDIFKERPIDERNWDFVLIHDDSPLWYNKKNYQIEIYRDTRFFNEYPEKKVFLNPKSLNEMEFDGYFMDELIDKIYFSETRNELKENITKLIRKEKKDENKRQVNGLRWVICDGDKYPTEMLIGKGYTPDKDFDYTSCPFWIFKVVFKS